MIEKVPVIHRIKSTLPQQKFHMFMKSSAVLERTLKTLHDILFLERKRIGILRIDRRKIMIQQIISFTVNLDCVI